MLGEDPAGLGLLLWDCARSVQRWAETPHHEVNEIFAPATVRMHHVDVLALAADPAIEGPLLDLAEMAAAPQRMSRERVGLACRRVSRWADSQGALATAFALAQAAAHACPGDARLAYEAGRLARRRADYARAETWLRRAFVLGRQNEDWRSTVDALGGLGNLWIQRGNYQRAERHHRHALKLARRCGLRDLEGQALHSLCGIAIEGGRIDEINAYARAAYEAFGDGHRRLPILAHDVAYAWMNEGYFARALQVFQAACPHFGRSQRVLVLADICRAAGGMGEVKQFEEAWTESWAFINNQSARDHVAQALLDLARGALSLGRWARAEMAVRRSLELATRRGEARVRVTAETVLDSILHERAAEASTTTSASTETAEAVRTLAADFVTSLTRHAVAEAHA